MGLKKLAAIAALAAACSPGYAFDLNDQGPSTLFYISIPLDAGLSRKERQIAYGIQLQGKREYQAVSIDSRTINRLLPLGDFDSKWIIAGVVAVGAAVAMSSSNKSTTSDLQAQQTRQQAQQPPAEPCPTVPVCE